MASMIHGISVTLYTRQQTGVDAFNAPVFAEVPVIVDNVLVSPVSSDDVVSDSQLHGKKAVYELSIPKSDTHDWEHCRVDFYGESWRTVGFAQRYLSTPLDWDRKIWVERYG